MVPAMFQVPISAPTARRMKIAPIADETPPTAASRSVAAVYPFLSATSAAKAALVSSATWSGPSAASRPKSAMVSVSSPTSTTTGASASRKLGARGTVVAWSEVSSVTVGQPSYYVVTRCRRRRRPRAHPRDRGTARPRPDRCVRRRAWRRCRAPPVRRSASGRRSWLPSDPLHRVPQERTGHAVAAAAALAQLETGDLDHLDARLAHLGDRVPVALVGHDDARLERDDVVAVVPLLALLLVCVATG